MNYSSANARVWVWLNARKVSHLRLAIIAAALLICSPLLAQLNTGRVSGTIVDQTGGVIAGATVTVVDVARGVSRPLTTDSAGLYAAPNLTPGIYTVRAEANGFQIVERQNIQVEVGGDVRVDLTLQPGAQTQTITVTEALPIVNTSNAETGGTLDNSIIMNLPSNGRNYRWMDEMIPGVFVKVGEGTSASSVNGTNGGYGVNCLIDGLYEQYMYQLECMVGSQSESGDTTILPLDAIQEINEVINPKAEYGWAPGVTQNIALKSGTNTIHGSAYAYGRDQDLDARNAFSFTPAGQPLRNPLSAEQFGATVGGAIKKDKLFYFGAYEGFRTSVFSTFGVTVPTTATLGGNATNSIPDAIAAMNLAGHPLSTLSLNIAGCNVKNGNLSSTLGATVATACAGNQYNALSLFNNFGSSQNLTNSFPDTAASDNSVYKLDYHLSDHNSINGSYFYGRYRSLSVPYGYNGTEPYWADEEGVQTQLGRVVEVWTPNSSWLNEARVGIDHDYRPVGRAECTQPGTQWNNPIGNGNPTGFDGGPNYVTQYDLVSGSVGCGIPSISISGFTGQVGYAQNRLQFDTDTQGADSLSYTRGKHQFKFGTDIRAEHFLGSKVLDSQTGVIGFGAAGNLAFTGATALEDFLAGVPSSETIRDGSPVRNITTDKIALFAQDDWRILPRVILNLGLRWEDETPLQDSHGLIGNFDSSAPSGMIQNGQVWKNQSDFSPHLGVAWDLTGKGTTVVRAGGYVAYMIPQVISFIANSGTAGGAAEDYGSEPTGFTLYEPNGSTIAPIGAITSGQVTQKPVTNLISGVVTNGLPWAAGTPIFSTAAGLLSPRCGNGLPSTGTGGGLNPPPCVATGGDPNIFTGYRYYAWNLNVQHAFTNDLSLDVGYVGSHSSDIPESYNINQPTPGSNVGSAEQLREPYYAQFPWFSTIEYIGNIGSGNYAGLQLLLKERVSHGLTFQASYTLSHGLAQGTVTNPVAPQLDYGSLPFDALHHFAFSATYAIPGRKSPGQLLEGWGVNFSVNALSGLPINAADSKDDTAGTGNSGERWNLYGPASGFNSILGQAGSVPCYGVMGSKFASSCIQVAAVGNMPSQCIAAANAEVVNPVIGQTGLQQLAAIGCYLSNGSAIVPPAQGTFGNMTYDELRGPRVVIINAALTKDIKIKERLNAQFKVEAFNLPNFTWYAAAQTNLGSPGTFGSALSTPDVAAGTPVTGSGGPRDIQLSMRITW